MIEMAIITAGSRQPKTTGRDCASSNKDTPPKLTTFQTNSGPAFTWNRCRDGPNLAALAGNAGFFAKEPSFPSSTLSPILQTTMRGTSFWVYSCAIVAGGIPDIETQSGTLERGGLRNGLGTI
jgi:hypothetical protein